MTSILLAVSVGGNNNNNNINAREAGSAADVAASLKERKYAEFDSR